MAIRIGHCATPRHASVSITKKFSAANSDSRGSVWPSYLPLPDRESDCVVCQARGRVAHKAHSLRDGFKNPGCGLVDNPPVLHWSAGHGGLHGVLSRTMALRMVSILRRAAIRADLGSTPRLRKRW